jgi:hypothetical protein
MGNTCTCLDENKDKDEFRSTTNKKEQIKEKDIVKI